MPDRQLFALDLAGVAPEETRERQAAAWRELDLRYDGSGPEGLLITLDAPDPAPAWQDPPTVLVGYGADGRQARLAYFSAARTTPLPGWPPQDDGFRVVAFAEQDAVGPDDVVALWTREGVLPADEARRRADEVLLVVLDTDGAPVGVSTAYLRRNEQLRLELWHLRAFVAAAHRRTHAGTQLAVRSLEHLEAAFASGRDTRSPGVLFEVENPVLKQHFPEGLWHETGMSLIGTNARGDHVRVRYFSGARLP